MQLIDKTTYKFMLVGIINTIVGTGVMFLLYNLAGVNYWISSASNYIVGSIVSYILNKYFTFNNKEKSLWQMIKFVVNISVCYLLAYGIAKPMVAFILSPLSVTAKDNIAMLVGMGLFVILNYMGQRFFVFKENK
ncbi:MAG: GtrA family protein [Clostridia bacterium]|nr:GtrA family protein [Clostridia bacterium]